MSEFYNLDAIQTSIKKDIAINQAYVDAADYISSHVSIMDVLHVSISANFRNIVNVLSELKTSAKAHNLRIVRFNGCFLHHD